MKRRSFLRGLLAAIPAIGAAKVVVQEAAQHPWYHPSDIFKRYPGYEYLPGQGLDPKEYEDLLSRTIENRSGELADNVLRNNALLQRLNNGR